MKKQFIGALSKLTPTLLLLLVVAATQAQSAVPEAGKKEAPVLVKYLGTQDDMVLFTVAYPNPQGTAFSLLVKDQDGTELYKNTYTEKSFNKQFRLPGTDRNKITFVIRNNKEADIVKTFQISVNSHYVEDVAVKKLD